jgi:hypothetical protein
VALPVQARAPVPQCLLETAEGMLILDVYDLGNGMTSHLENQQSRGSHLVVSSCHTGQFLRVSVWEGHGAQRREYPAVLEVFDALSAPSGLVTFDALAQALAKEGVPAFSGISRAETCACQARYPDLRGTKTPYP